MNLELTPQQIDEYRLRLAIQRQVRLQQGYVVKCDERTARKGPGRSKAKACKNPQSAVELRRGL